ncbi:hypothetical protein Cgig2_008711 [Carnegiea gigantea]|uniref:Endonuclease/exonuclease/phosphatase domain-containing protein n=1 Tax=Carnegiea gigantea TaxID=171969 RepID=A0A9Q1GTD1_9CARY|nr:hypothetical protein Cgig2_008711 [Carnegiea gigantea]
MARGGKRGHSQPESPPPVDARPPPEPTDVTDCNQAPERPPQPPSRPVRRRLPWCNMSGFQSSAHCQMMGHTEAECREKTGIRQEWRRVVRDTAPFSHTARTDAARSPTKAAKTQPEQTVTLTIQLEHPVNDNVQNVQPAQPHQNMDSSPSASANTQSPDRASEIDQSDADGFTIVRWKQSSRPNTRSQIILHTTEQILHTHVTDQHTHKQFHATFIYGFNHMAQRHPLWADLLTIAHRTTIAWCIIGDFNTILRPEDRIGGDPELQNCLDSCELTELPSTGAYFTWTNKTVWSRIDRALVNGLWHDTFDYTNAHFGASGISDHSPMLLQFLQTSKSKHMFQYCDMWATHHSFHHLISKALTCMHGQDPIQRLISFMDCIRPLLRRLSRNKYRDLWAQQTQVRQHLTDVQEALALSPQNQTLLAKAQDLRTKYLDITASILSLMRQQTKMEWIGYGDSGSRLFFARAKQHKLASYIYTLHTSQGELVEGFDDVGKHMSLFYRHSRRGLAPPTSVVAHTCATGNRHLYHIRIGTAQGTKIQLMDRIRHIQRWHLLHLAHPEQLDFQRAPNSSPANGLEHEIADSMPDSIFESHFTKV